MVVAKVCQMVKRPQSAADFEYEMARPLDVGERKASEQATAASGTRYRMPAIINDVAMRS